MILVGVRIGDSDWYVERKGVEFGVWNDTYELKTGANSC